MTHFISLDQAVQMTTLYRQEKEKILAIDYKGKNILAICETFEATAFAKLLAEPGCVKVRIYYGMSDDLNIHAIIVGANDKNEDILPGSNQSSIINSLTDIEDVILEEGFRCPDECPPTSPLNP